jgi:hypothetical protein
MIFKHLFRSKHQNPNPQVRIQAIENLNEQDPEQKSILHELAFNDADVNVSLAALQKLDSFVLWYKMAEIAKNERVQKRSQKMVEEALLNEQNDTLDATEKRKFVVECQDNRLLEKLLSQVWVQQDTELAMQLLQKVDKPQLQEKLLLESQNESLQLAILSMLEDGPQQRRLLNRLLKKSHSEQIKVEGKRYLDTWLRAESLPLEIEQQVKMVLSRLLALKDSSDFSSLQIQQQTLEAEYKTLAKDFSCLTDVKKSEIEQKFADISQKVNRTVATLEPQWKADQAQKEIRLKIDSIVAKVKHTLGKIAEQLSTRMSEITESESSDFGQTISAHNQELQALIRQVSTDKSSEHKQLEQLQQDLLSSQSTLDNLPNFQSSIQEANEILEKFVALALPNDQSQVEAAQDYANELKYQWRNVIGNYKAYLPAELTEGWKQRSNEWQLALKELKSQINADLIRCRNKIRAVDSLINQGKFKAAMGLYQKVQVWFLALPEKQQAQLDKSFNSIKEQIENLQDWQEYIAAPRKPALFKEVELLIDTPLSVDEQAKAVKSLRAQWNSLGKLDTESDQALNLAFDEAVEKAFEPCRLHYDKQQKEREQHLTEKQQIISHLSDLNQADLAMSEVAKSLRNFQQKWRNTGEVDYKIRADLYEQYQKLVTPLKGKINQYYQDNQEQKQKLVDKALKLNELESVDEAIEEVKKLQAQWKTIEHAGKKAESELWPAFRQANDQIFAKRSAANQQHKQAIKEQVAQAKQAVVSIEQALDGASDKASIQQALQGKDQVEVLLKDLPHGEGQSLHAKYQSLLERQKQKLTGIKAQEKDQQFIDLFSVLKRWEVGSDIKPEITRLAKPWQQSFLNESDTVDRHELTIKMEIISGLDSPKADAGIRKNIQMHLMAQKLQTGEALDLPILLKDWISGGPLNEANKPLLQRLENVFLNPS